MGGSGEGASPGQGPASGAEAAAAAAANVNNILFGTYVLVSLASFAVAFTMYRIILTGVRYSRTLACMNNEKQIYFKASVQWFALVKQHLIYAPLFRTRHHRELWLVKGWSIGVLPTRFQSLFIAGVVATNVALCTVGIEWSQSGSVEMLDHLRNRTGTIAVVNMIPLVIMAGRNNPLIVALGLSYDTFNMVHRWFGRIITAETVAHTVSFFLMKVWYQGGWLGLQKALQSGSVPTTGLIAFVAFVTIILQASTIVRRAFYEFFLHFHIILVVLALVALWYHLQNLPQLVYIKVFIALWVVERAIRLGRLLYRNFGAGGTHVVIESVPGDALRVHALLARPWNFKPGQHMFITIPSVGLWTSHPFSIAWWTENEASEDPENRMVVGEDFVDKAVTTVHSSPLAANKIYMSAIIRRRDGFTLKLFKKVAASADGRLSATAFVEGPYGGENSLHSYGTVLLFAGGVGITHQIPYIRDLLVGHVNDTVAARRISLVWVIQSPEALEWIRPWMTTILALERRRDVLRIQLFVTRPRSTKEIHSPSSTVQMFPGRPNVDTLIQMECQNQVGAMAVASCGPGHLSDDVRRSVRKRQSSANIDFIEESFSW